MRRLRILTVVFNLFIIIGAGHGIGPLGLFEIFGVGEFLTGNFEFNITGQYNDRLLTVAVMSFIGQFVLVLAFIFDKKVKSGLTVFGCIVLLTAIFILTQNFIGMNLDTLSLVFSLPCMVTAIILLTRETKALLNKES